MSSDGCMCVNEAPEDDEGGRQIEELDGTILGALLGPEIFSVLTCWTKCCSGLS